MKKILIMPGTQWLVALAEKIRGSGCAVALVDPHADCPCVRLADSFLQSDIFDTGKVLDFCRRERIDGVLSDECDIVMGEIARIGREFSLSALSPEAARLYTDKFRMRERCSALGIPHPEYRLCHTDAEAVVFLDQLGCPIILKPLDSNSSHGVFTAKTAEDIRRHFKETIGFSRGEKCVLAERYVVGTEFTVDGIKTPAGHFTLAISEKKHFAHNENIACELLFTHENDRFDYGLLKQTNDRFVENSGLDFGLTHAEYKFADGKFYQIEIAARGGGNMISSVIAPFMSGHDTYSYLIDCALGKVANRTFDIPSSLKDRAAVLRFFPTPGGSGRVARIRGLDVLESNQDIAQYRMNFKPGDFIEDAVSDSARIGFYIACCENRERLQTVMDLVERSVRIEYEE